MEIGSITSKHQITIPAGVRHSLNLQKGDRLSFEVSEDGRCIVRKVALQKSDGAARAYLKPGHPPVSGKRIKEAVKEGTLASWNRRGQ